MTVYPDASADLSSSPPPAWRTRWFSCQRPSGSPCGSASPTTSYAKRPTTRCSSRCWKLIAGAGDRKRGEKLVDRYRDAEKLLGDLPKDELLPSLPRTPFIGELDYLGVARALAYNRSRYGRAERILLDRLCDCLAFKSQPRLVKGH